MYFKNISNPELCEFSHKIKVNFKITLGETLLTDLFKVEPINDLLKIYPLFYCDKIISSNSKDKIVGNKCIICENKSVTCLYFITDENLPLLSLDYIYRTDYNDYWVFYVYDRANGNSVMGVSAYATIKNENEIVTELELFSDEKGLVYFDLSDLEYDEMKIEFKLMDSIQQFEYKEDSL